MVTVPFDTLKLARRFEAAGFDPKQAGDMAEAIAETMADTLVTKTDLAIAIRDIKIWTGSVGLTLAAAANAILFGALHLWPPR